MKSARPFRGEVRRRGGNLGLISVGPRTNAPPAVDYSALASQFSAPYQINEQVLSGHSDRIANSAANLDKIYSGYQTREQAANERMKALEQGYDARYDRAMGFLEQAQQNEISRINEDFQKQSASSMQDLVSRGLRNSSLAATKNLGVERARQQAIADVNESIRRERLNTDATLSRDALAAGERGVEIGLDSSGDRLNFSEQANRTQNDTTLDRLEFTERTKEDYPGYREMMAIFEKLGRAGLGRNRLGLNIRQRGTANDPLSQLLQQIAVTPQPPMAYSPRI